MATFTGLEIASRALKTNQSVLDVVGHNVANVNTPGYSRQTAALVATPPDTAYDAANSNFAAQLGTGVDLASVSRIRDEFIEVRLQNAEGDQSKYNSLRDALQRVEDTFNELSTDGVGKQMTATFNAFLEVARAPEGDSARSLLRSQGETVSRTIRQVFNGLNNLDADLKGRGAMLVQQVNDLASQVADLNGQIHVATIVGGHPNDLEDKRDILVKQIAGLVGAQAQPDHDAQGNPTGYVTVRVNGATLVQEDKVNPLPDTFAMQAGVPQLAGSDFMVPVKSGEVSGLIQASDMIAHYVADLNSLVSTFISTVNTQHQAGYGLNGQTGLNFFSGTNASDIGMDANIEGDLSAIAASTPPVSGSTVAPSNGDNARLIADIGSRRLFGTQTLVAYHSAKMAQVGADAQGAERQAANQEKVVQQLQNMRDSTSGVNLDEELTHMLQYQRSYQAAARMVTMFDSLVEDLIGMVR
jgi:flagellar hook-associated protein 1 FlgK